MVFQACTVVAVHPKVENQHSDKPKAKGASTAQPCPLHPPPGLSTVPLQDKALIK